MQKCIALVLSTMHSFFVRLIGVKFTLPKTVKNLPTPDRKVFSKPSKGV